MDLLNHLTKNKYLVLCSTKQLLEQKLKLQWTVPDVLRLLKLQIYVLSGLSAAMYCKNTLTNRVFLKL